MLTPPVPPRPRVAYLITNSEIGGAQTHVADLLRALRDRVDATVLAGGNGPLFTAAQAAGARTVMLHSLDNRLSPWRAVGAFLEVLRALRAAAPDLVHVHSAKAGALGRLAAWWLGVPVVYTVHGFAFKPAAPMLRRLAARVTERCLAPVTTRLICVAQAERALAASLPIPAARIDVIRNGVADTPLRAQPDAPLRHIVMVARLAAPKRPDLLIRAFARACEDHALDGCELVIAGAGPAMAELQALAERVAPGRVSLCGNVADIAAWLASAQIFALISDHEGLPLSVLEAMRAGLPVVASDLPGIREQLGHADGADARLIAGNDVDALARTLRELAASPALRARLGAQARARYERDFGLDAMADATWRVYRQALAGRSADLARAHPRADKEGA